MEAEEETKMPAAKRACGYVVSTKIFLTTVLMWVCLGAIVIMCFFPPWIGIAREDGHDDMRAPVGYHFVFRPPVWPTVSDSSDYLLIEHYENRIYFEKLGLQCIAALGIAAMMYYIKVNDKKKKQKN